MTLIATLLDRNGIVLATDSNLTMNDQFSRQAPKNFELPHLHGGLSIAGRYSVGGTPLDIWMPMFVERPETYESGTLEGFADCLRKALDCEMEAWEKQDPTLVHIAGYSRIGDGFRPEMHFVRNATGIDKDTGAYSGISDTFQTDEQYWQSYCRHKECKTGFLPAPHPYDFSLLANGFHSARAGLFTMIQSLRPGFNLLWNERRTEFRPPASLEESKCFAGMVMSIVNALFQMSDYSAPYVGGDIQLIGVSVPT
jgi:hypothetical protein